MQAKIFVTLKKGVHDPQGEAVKGSLVGLGYKEVNDVRVGKCLEVKLAETDRVLAETRLKEMCDRLLANPVIESYRVELES